MGVVKDFRELDVYQRAFALAERIYRLSRTFPPEERYSLTDQVRRSSRAVCANIAEAWRKRRYVKSFESKLTDADAEAAETLIWLEFACAHRFIDQESYDQLEDECRHVCSQLSG